MKLKTFNAYSDYYSKNPKNFEEKIAFASSGESGLSIFKKISTVDEALQIGGDIPLIQWNGFSFSENTANENFCSVVYNQSRIPTPSELSSKFKEEEFIPKEITDRSLVKKMKFPIIARSANGFDEFKTYGKFKKSEIPYRGFQEKLIPTSRFEVLVSGSTPIHLQKKINRLPFDMDLNRWSRLGEAKSIFEKIKNEWSPEYYIAKISEANGRLYLDSITRSGDLTPAQGVSLYVKAYEDHYSSLLPNWFRKKLFEDHIKPYYKKRYYDSLLLKPKGVIDYKKYLD